MKIEWVNYEDIPHGQLRSFAALFSKYNSQELILNVKSTFKVLKIAPDIFLLVTINNEEWNNSYVCSPYTAFVLYSKDELVRKIKNKIVQFPLLIVIKILGYFLKFGRVNKNIHINNFLMATNPYPIWQGEQIKDITQFIKQNYPDHAIIFRSLNKYQHQNLINTFKQENYNLICSRQVYIFDNSYENWWKHKNNKHDNRLIKKRSLIYLDHAQMEDYLDQAFALYNKLYIQKYSLHNPQLTLEYFKRCYAEKIIYFQGYKDTTNTLKAFSGLFVLGETITSPLVGYDTDAPQKDGLYIHAIKLIMNYKFNCKLLLNLSSGASSFKRLRGGVPSLEYMAVYVNHLSFTRRFTLGLLQFLSNKIGVPLLDKYKL